MFKSKILIDVCIGKNMITALQRYNNASGYAFKKCKQTHRKTNNYEEI
jgi:hypothetical protein